MPHEYVSGVCLNSASNLVDIQRLSIVGMCSYGLYSYDLYSFFRYSFLAYIVMAYTVMAYTVMAYIVMAKDLVDIRHLSIAQARNRVAICT